MRSRQGEATGKREGYNGPYRYLNELNRVSE